MPTTRTPPIEFTQIGLAADTFRYSDARSWRGACPTCGGHHRFVIFTDHDFPLWHGYCDSCGLKEKYWERYKKERQPLTAEQIAQRNAEYQRQEVERATTRAERLKYFTSGDLLDELHDRMQGDNRQWWRAQGIPDSLQDWWRLGYEKSHKCVTDNGNWFTPAYTIPHFHHAETEPQFMTMQYRLANPPNPKDRYRFAFGLGATYFDTDPYENLKPSVIICEGAKKAMNVYQIIDPNKTSVIAQPSKSGDYGIADAVKQAEHIFIIFDPDGLQNAHAKAKQIGRRARVVDLPDKIDDMIISKRLDERNFEIALRHARKATI